MYVPVVTLSTKENLKLTKLLSKGFKRSVFWNEYNSKIETYGLDNNNLKRILLDSSFRGVNKLIVAAYNNKDNDANRVQRNSIQKYLLTRVMF